MNRFYGPDGRFIVTLPTSWRWSIGECVWLEGEQLTIVSQFFWDGDWHYYCSLKKGKL